MGDGIHKFHSMIFHGFYEFSWCISAIANVKVITLRSDFFFHHSVIWNADEFSSGIYFVQMIAGDYIQNQKIMLVK